MIDWKLLSEALVHFQSFDFKYIEVPWLVSEESIRATLPEDVVKNPWRCEKGYFIGSGEQGFVELMPMKGRYCTITPCFRAEPVVDELHQYWFMKLELWSDHVARSELDFMMNVCAMFYQNRTEAPLCVMRPWQDDMSADFYINGIEVGSFGVRETPKQKFVYGTGLALPRFSIATGMK